MFTKQLLDITRLKTLLSPDLQTFKKTDENLLFEAMK